LIAEAKNNKEIASELFISDQTVGVHRKNMMKKLGVHNTVNLVKLALEYQLVE
jgi:DNA-binding NarL/FixJ family response regulator